MGTKIDLKMKQRFFLSLLKGFYWGKEHIFLKGDNPTLKWKLKEIWTTAKKQGMISYLGEKNCED